VDGSSEVGPRTILTNLGQDPTVPKMGKTLGAARAPPATEPPERKTNAGAKTNFNERVVAEQLHGGCLRTASSAPWRSRTGARL
jgi:hypothetical protein